MQVFHVVEFSREYYYYAVFLISLCLQVFIEQEMMYEIIVYQTIFT